MNEACTQLFYTTKSQSNEPTFLCCKDVNKLAKVQGAPVGIREAQHITSALMTQKQFMCYTYNIIH